MPQRIRLAFLGFRHAHVMGLYQSATNDPRVEVVAACEEHPPTAAALREAGKVALTHDRIDAVLHHVPCDAVAIGDYFARRGELIIAALEAGKHVISDKPICTRRSELEQIERLAASRQRVVSCLLDLRDHGSFRAMRRLIQEGTIGPIHTVTFTAQHPLLLDRRPSWYFEPGKHGGTINDIAIHAIDLLPWLTGRGIAAVVAARAWNARLPQHPHFQDAAQLMLRLDNDGGVLGDVSYLAPDGLAYTSPQYWRLTCHGTDGVIETAYPSREVHLATKQDQAIRTISAKPDRPQGRLDDFLQEIQGESGDDAPLRTPGVIDASRKTLIIQEAADKGLRNVPL